MGKDRFVVGEVYFHVTYPDARMCYPGIESLVFLGKNLSDEDTDDTWYFQPASSYGRHGSALSKNDATLDVECFDGRRVADVLDLASLMTAIEEATQRRNANSK